MRWFLIVFLFIVCALPVFADDIMFTVNHTDYYFRIGENAVVPLSTESDFEEPVRGMLTYAITQKVQQGNSYYSSSNTQSQAFEVQPEENTLALELGTVNAPTDLTVNIKFSYSVDEAIDVDLPEFYVHFVHDEQQNQGKQQQSSSQEQAEKQKQQEKQRQEQQKREQQQRQAQQQSKLQNNQAAADSNALKKEMQQQVAQQKQLEQEFAKQVSQNEQFQEAHKQLEEQGYKQTHMSTSPQSQDTGEFKAHYQNENGETAEIAGDMEQGEMKNLETTSTQEQKKLQQALQNNEQFQQFEQQLQEQGFTPTDFSYDAHEEHATVEQKYQNPEGEQRSITATVTEENVEDVVLHGEEEEKSYTKYLLLLLVLAGGAYYYWYKKRQSALIQETHAPAIKKPFNYRAAAHTMLTKAQKQFDAKEYKDAYGTVAQAVRLYLSHKHGLGIEITNDALIKHLKAKKIAINDIKKCFDICNMVEFAKYKANKKDFTTALNYAKKLLI